ncbi:MAG: hypothetical protein HC819_22680 [Cyclobacteriaceae bacterium]|nr:hypothetical protein [Cyclobacteriaceae bacterium]
MDEEAYMGFVVPGVIAFSLGILIFAPRYSFTKTYEDIQKLVTEQPKLAYRLIAIGLISTYLNPYMPAAIGFVLYLTAAFQYVGLALLLFQPHSKKKWIWFAAIMGALAVSSIVKGMFHDLILWSVLLFSYVLVQFKVNFLGKLLIILAGLAVAALIQSIKSELRSNKEEQGTGQRITLFSDLLKERIEGEELNNEEILTEMASVRLNQGWIISSILFNVPRYEPFADGETIMEALTSSILPRFLVPSKKVAGGRENFRQFSGLQISDGTSMGASVIGEAYANYGNYGGWIFMFIWGAFLAWGLSMMVNYGRRHPIIYVFIPLIFLQVIKAETELSVVLNHFVKSSLLVFLFLWGARNVLKWKI